MERDNRTAQQIAEDLDRADAEFLENHPGLNSLKEWGEERRRKEAAEEREKQARIRQERAERQKEEEERAKRSALTSWTLNGGTEAEFEEAWPSLRLEMLKRRVLEDEANARADQRRSGISSL